MANRVAERLGPGSSNRREISKLLTCSITRKGLRIKCLRYVLRHSIWRAAYRRREQAANQLGAADSMSMKKCKKPALLCFALLCPSLRAPIFAADQ